MSKEKDNHDRLKAMANRLADVILYGMKGCNLKPNVFESFEPQSLEVNVGIDTAVIEFADWQNQERYEIIIKRKT